MKGSLRFFQTEKNPLLLLLRARNVPTLLCAHIDQFQSKSMFPFFGRQSFLERLQTQIGTMDLDFGLYLAILDRKRYGDLAANLWDKLPPV
jgi:hypothetical protein